MVFFPASDSLGFRGVSSSRSTSKQMVFLEQDWNSRHEEKKRIIPLRLLHQILIHDVLVSFSYIPMACMDDISTYICCKRSTECRYYGHNHLHEVTKFRTKWILWELKFIIAWSILKQQITMRNFWSLYDRN